MAPYANEAIKTIIEYTSSVKVTAPFVEQIMSQVHQLPEDSLIRSPQQEVRAERAKKNGRKSGEAEGSSATEKCSFMWLMSLPLKAMEFNLNKREFRDGLSLHYD